VRTALGPQWVRAYRYLLATALTIIAGTFALLELVLAFAGPLAPPSAAGIAAGLALGTFEGRMEGRRLARELGVRGQAESTWAHPHPAFGLLTILLLVAVVLAIVLSAAGPVIALVGLIGGLGSTRAALTAVGLRRLEIGSARTVAVHPWGQWWTYRFEPSLPGEPAKYK